MSNRNRRTYIYAWICPDTGHPIYVGKTSVSIAVRQRHHINTAREGIEPSLKYVWLREILSQGKELEVVELERCVATIAGEIERSWVTLLSERFFLLNTARAGAGGPGIGRVKWTENLIARLGQEHDATIALDLGCDRKTVAYRRIILGIAPCTLAPSLPSNTIHLQTDVLELLGKESDRMIANRLGISDSVIKRHRLRLGIESYAIATGNDGRIRKGENKKRWGESKVTDECMSLLGTMPDEDLGQRYGISKSVICLTRKKHGIKSYAAIRDKNSRQRKHHTRCRKKPNEVIPLLGTMLDKALAQKFGISISTVSNTRQKLGIPSFSKQGRRKKRD